MDDALVFLLPALTFSWRLFFEARLVIIWECDCRWSYLVMLDYSGHCVFLVYIKTGSEHVTQDRNKHSRRMKGHLCSLAWEVVIGNQDMIPGELTVGLGYVPN